MTNPFQGISLPLSNNTAVKRRYSVTQDVVAYRRCARQYGVFNVHKYAPAEQTQAYFGTVLHQVLDRCHAHFHGISDPATKGLLPDHGQILSEEDISDYFGEAKSARKTGKIDPLPPSDLVKYFIQVENGLNSKGILAIRSELRVQAVKILQYFNALEGPTLYPRVKDTRPLAKVKNSPPSVPPRLRGEARKIRLPNRDFGEGWGGVSAFLQEVYRTQIAGRSHKSHSSWSGRSSGRCTQ